jgi:hypothetical protein
VLAAALVLAVAWRARHRPGRAGPVTLIHDSARPGRSRDGRC